MHLPSMYNATHGSSDPSLKDTHLIHGRHHWITVGFVLAATLFTLTEVHGQQVTTGSGAMFQGRPEIAGANSGLGAQAGMPQGGLGMDGTEVKRGGLNLRKPGGYDDFAKPRPTDADTVASNANQPTPAPMTKSESLAQKSDRSIAREQASPVKKTRRAATRVAQSARHGVPAVDTTASVTPK